MKWACTIFQQVRLKSTSYPNMTAFHSIILFSVGAPLTPAGGSSCNLKKSKIIIILWPNTELPSIIFFDWIKQNWIDKEQKEPLFASKCTVLYFSRFQNIDFGFVEYAIIYCAFLTINNPFATASFILLCLPLTFHIGFFKKQFFFLKLLFFTVSGSSYNIFVSKIFSHQWIWNSWGIKSEQYWWSLYNKWKT